LLSVELPLYNENKKVLGGEHETRQIVDDPCGYHSVLSSLVVQPDGNGRIPGPKRRKHIQGF
jgi:hypothetical protein